MLNRPFTPFLDNGNLALPDAGESYASEDESLHIHLVRDVNLNAIIEVSHAKHNRHRDVDIAILQETLDIDATELLLGRVSANGTQCQQHPV
jgi:hypothetical protein